MQWDKSIDDPYLQSYKLYYYTTSGDTESLNAADHAASYTLLGGLPIPINPSGLKPITIDKSNTQITLHFPDNSKDYYFVVTAVDTRGLEGIPTPEISIIKLMVSKAGTGAGVVTSSPLGIRSEINCGPSCRADYTGGTTVTLTAAPDAGNALTGWSGVECPGTGPCVVTVSPAITVTATFMPIRRLDVLKAGAGTGTVTSSPSGIRSEINCGTACASESVDYIISTLVTLTATSDLGYTFTGWSGVECPGTGPCVVTMDTIKNVTAMFAIKGDLNLDGTVNLADAILALQAFVGLNPPDIQTDYATSGADVDGDNKLGLPEVIYILQKAAGIR